MNELNKLVEVHDLKVHFPTEETLITQIFPKTKKMIKAVDGVTFDIFQNQTLAIVGESGCGKSTLGRALVGLNSPMEGNVIFNGLDLNVAKKTGQIKKMRRDLQFIFQDPFSSLNPRMRVSEIVGRPLEIHEKLTGKAKEKRVDELLVMVGLAPYLKSKYPHEFSGGQKQRISIARALASSPKFIVADEPTAALDVSIQCQILNLLIDLKQMLSLTMVFISHDLEVVRYISDWVAVMYLGKFVEFGTTGEIFDNPLHPYTKALLSAVPTGPGERSEQRLKLSGNIPSIVNIPTGCRLHPRCPFATDLCKTNEPYVTAVTKDHSVSCHHIGQ